MFNYKIPITENCNRLFLPDLLVVGIVVARPTEPLPSCLRLHHLSTKTTTPMLINTGKHEETVITAIIQVFSFWDLEVSPTSAVSGCWLMPLLLVGPAPMDGSDKLGGDDGSPVMAKIDVILRNADALFPQVYLHLNFL